ncbi:unnamed protein product [Bursaphelenchus okinawaensis]|uniref:Choline/ethanolamine kinase n=1 Tax=Bursaphelenchus okinawaensis TaxID=465554 RepID=A0A811KHE8_9BILA|nr:unnamed protein product [Bursaphelenchus okinawaensis]CAG9103236.1 unnamed protein product [Bursaphelenchus okinawaensis]
MRELLLALPQDSDYSSNHKVKEAAHTLCKKFLANQWSSASSENVKLKQITGGTSNLLFLVSVDHAEQHRRIPNQILIRINFSPDGASQWLTESVIFSQLSEKKIGPKLYGVFEQGRLEEFIPSRPLTTLELWNNEFSKEIAEKLARIHKISAPIDKEPTFIMDCIDRWFERYVEVMDRKSGKIEVKLPKVYKNELTIGKEELKKEIEFIRNALTKTKSKVRFCHNDLQENNILLVDKPQHEGKKLSFIDFEYACYNYRGHDIANHFNEHVINYTQPDYPYYEVYYDKELDQAHMLNFCRNYLKEYHNQEPKDSEVRELLDETLPFLPISDFLWAIWSLYMGETSPISFGYKTYAEDRFGLYFKNRRHLATM